MEFYEIPVVVTNTCNNFSRGAHIHLLNWQLLFMMANYTKESKIK